jgi:brefeldin A-resistance guanine nucleotide exchange factor 1
MIHQLTSRIPELIRQSHLESNEGESPSVFVSFNTADPNSALAWSAYWSPIFGALTTQCTNPCREIRHQAFSSLQRSLLSDELKSENQESWTAIFDEVLFPLILRLLKPEVYSSDPIGMSETRVQAATLLCRIFLHYLPLLSKWDGMLDLWLKILDIMDRLMNSGQGDSLVSVSSMTSNRILLTHILGGGRSREPEEYPSRHVYKRVSYPRERGIISRQALDRNMEAP